ncbi:hypothetical protein HYPSUDRAFT_214661 [Hypholoma sublateritium FD-334 SS-4]|uniref:Uncharacterized protein n=1 Tax=Hypholoma sublateritium (strain FD-334 SS-4) TaxID=945553 RepID=A0A0D2PXS4_HYPSF|nr:hypothetical protein HYPSUDRAFT_214661 [Hypholoma sublateritium FD-334 SS-4]
MSSLKNLILKFFWPREKDIRDIPPLLIPVLGLCKFSLATLCVPLRLLDSWVFNQKQLKVLEIQHDSWDLLDRQHHLLSICEQLTTRNLYPPTLFLISSCGLMIGGIIAFPAFQANRRWNAKDIADSIAWGGHRIILFKLVMRTLSDEDLVHDVLTSTAAHFVNISSLVFLVQDPRIHTSPSAFASLLQKFWDLHNIRFEYYGGLDRLTPAPYQQNRLGLAQSENVAGRPSGDGRDEPANRGKATKGAGKVTWHMDFVKFLELDK